MKIDDSRPNASTVRAILLGLIVMDATTIRGALTDNGEVKDSGARLPVTASVWRSRDQQV
jgi:hypothetical protein